MDRREVGIKGIIRDLVSDLPTVEEVVMEIEGTAIEAGVVDEAEGDTMVEEIIIEEMIEGMMAIVGMAGDEVDEVVICAMIDEVATDATM